MIINKKVNNFNFKNLKSDLLNNFRDQINNTKELSNPGKIPNSLITKPASQAPYVLYKFVGILFDANPQLGSSGLKETKIKQNDIELKRRIKVKTE